MSHKTTRRKQLDKEGKAYAAKKNKEYRLRSRKKAIAHYGGKCACCGETEYKFLALDHVNNDGAEHRRKDKGKAVFLSIWASVNGFPDTLQVLCHNCNLAKAYYGVCPHKTNKGEQS